MPNGDFDVTLDPNDAPVATDQMRYLEGFGLPAQQAVSSSATQYLHGDLIRSTNLLTDGNGAALATTAYTAFGELVTGYSEPATRYQCAGGWGYESRLLVLEGAPGTDPITLQHVGFRWYEPSVGRFVQRDPVGIYGGMNVYAYGSNNPLVGLDASGLNPERKYVATGNYKWVWTGKYRCTVIGDEVFVVPIEVKMAEYAIYEEESHADGVAGVAAGTGGGLLLIPEPTVTKVAGVVCLVVGAILAIHDLVDDDWHYVGDTWRSTGETREGVPYALPEPKVDE